MYQLLTRLGLRPDAVVGHSSGELLALAAAGVFPADRVLEQKLGRLGSIFRGFEVSGDLPEARLVAVAADRHRVEALCAQSGPDDAAVAMDNCPHQVVLAVSPAEFEPIVGRLRAGGHPLGRPAVLARLSHAELRPGGRPDRRFLRRDDASAPRRFRSIPAHRAGECPMISTRFASSPSSSGRQTVAFRETIEAMHADGLRLFVDVGARGNLAGFVEDILRGKPAFAIAANLPRRSGLTQLNHLVASMFAQGVPLESRLSLRTPAPSRNRLERSRAARSRNVELAIGFPRMQLSETMVARLRAASHSGRAPR